MPTRHYGVVVPDSQKVPCIISTYQRAYGSRTTDRPYVLEVMCAKYAHQPRFDIKTYILDYEEIL